MWKEVGIKNSLCKKLIEESKLSTSTERLMCTTLSLFLKILPIFFRYSIPTIQNLAIQLESIRGSARIERLLPHMK